MSHPTNGEPEQNDSNPESAATPTSSSVAIRPPQFYRQNVAVWFAQLESQFSLRPGACGLIANTLPSLLGRPTRGHGLPPRSASEPDYGDLKAQLLSMFDKSQSQKLEEALSALDIGHYKPSVAAQNLRQEFAAAGLQADDDLIKHRILHAVSTALQAALATQRRLPLAEFLVAADDVFDLPMATTAAIAPSSPGPSSPSKQ